MRPISRALLGAVLGVSVAVGALAAPKGKPKGAGETPGLEASSLSKLRADDLTAIQAGLDDARLAGKKGAAAVPLIASLLERGLPYKMAEAALDTLADIESDAATPAIIPYAVHRDVGVRRAAVRALGKMHAPAAAAPLRAALADGDPQVRGAAATALGSLRVTDAVSDLFLALDRNVFEAAVSIGELCTPRECAEFLGRLGKVPFDVMTTGVDPLLFRPAVEVTDDAKIDAVNRVRDQGSHEANVFLAGVVKRWPKNGSPAVKRALDAAVAATSASPGAGK